MADTKISALTDGTTAEGTDRIAVARDPTGTPLSRYITPAYVAEYMRTLTQTLTNKTLTTPVLGVATATSINKVAFTAPATSATLTLSNGSSLITSGGHSLTFTTTGSTNVTLPTTGTVLTTATGASLGANTFTALQTITQASANTGIIASTGYSLTGSDATSMVSLAGTWNTTGTPTALLLNITDTASNAASKLIDLQTSSTSRFSVSYKSNVTAIATDPSNSVASISFANGGSTFLTYYGGAGYGTQAAQIQAPGGLAITGTNKTLILSTDTILTRHAANVLAQRNSTTAQAHKWNYSYTNDSNESYAYVDLNTANTLTFGSNGIGTGAGVVTKFKLVVDGTTRLDWGVGAASTWTVNGAISTNNDITAAGSVQIGTGQKFLWFGRTRMYASADGNLRIGNSADNDFGLLQLGGTTSSYPAFKRSDAVVQAKLADDTAFAFTQTKLLLETASPPSSASDTGTQGEVRWASGFVYVCTATNTWQRAAIATW